MTLMSCILYEAVIWNTLFFLDSTDTLGVFAQSIGIGSLSPIPAWILLSIGSKRKSVVSSIATCQMYAVDMVIYLQAKNKRQAPEGIQTQMLK